MDFFEKVSSGTPFMIHHSVGGSRFMAACNPYESKRGVRGVIFHDIYWTEADRPAVHLVHGDVVKLDKDSVEGHYAVVKKDENGNVVGFEPITQVFPGDLRWGEWEEYLDFLRKNPSENQENAKKSADKFRKMFEQNEDMMAELSESR